MMIMCFLSTYFIIYKLSFNSLCVCRRINILSILSIHYCSSKNEYYRPLCVGAQVFLALGREMINTPVSGHVVLYPVVRTQRRPDYKPARH